MKIDIKGAKELSDYLSSLPEQVERKYMRKSLKDGAQVVAAGVAFSAPIRTGELVSSIAIKAKGADVDVALVYYGRFINDGTVGRSATGERKTRKGLERARAGLISGLVGKIAPTHFMTNAAKESAPEAVEATASSLKSQIEANAGK